MRQTLILDKYQASLEYDNGCLVLRTPDEPVRRIPLRYLERIVCLHHADIHTRALAYLQDAGVDFVYLNSRSSHLSFALHAPHQAQCLRRCKQYQLITHPSSALTLGQRLVRYKISCAVHAIVEHAAHGSTETYPERQVLFDIRSLITPATDWAVLRGLEGTAQRHLFGYWRRQLPNSLEFTHRQRRPPPDPVNAMLSLSYTLVYHEAIRQCLLRGLDPWLGFYHRPAHGRQSLACDLMEPLRPDIERWVVGLFVEHTLTGREFGQHNGACMLGKKGRSTYYRHWYEKLPAWPQHLQRITRRLANALDHMQPLDDGPAPQDEI